MGHMACAFTLPKMLTPHIAYWRTVHLCDKNDLFFFGERFLEFLLNTIARLRLLENPRHSVCVNCLNISIQLRNHFGIAHSGFSNA